MPEASEPVHIVGGGIGGLTLGVLLQERGTPFRIWERESAVRSPGAGLGLSAPTVRFLESIGIDFRDPQLSTPVRHIDLRTRTGRTLQRLNLDYDASDERYPRAVRRVTLHRLLEQKIRPDWLIRDHRITSFREGPSSISVCAEDESESSPGSAIVGADGVRSIVRQWLGKSPLKLRYTGYTAWQAIVRGNVPEPGVSTLVIGSGSEFGYVQAGAEYVYWYATLRSSRPPPRGDDPVPILRGAFSEWSHPAKQLIEATPAEQIIMNPVHYLPPFPHWSSGRLTLLGDAAHPMTPHLGQGATLAIEDAGALANVLSSPHFALRDFGTYERARYPRTRRMMTESARLGRILHWANPFSVRLRDWAISILPSSYYRRWGRRIFFGSNG